MRIATTLPFLTLLVATQLDAEVKYKAYYEGIPDYEKTVPFRPEPLKAHRDLRTVLRGANPSVALCLKGTVPATVVDPHELKTNICDPSAYSAIGKLLKDLAPSLDQTRLAFRKLDLNRDGEPELLVEYVDLIGDERVKDPYLTLWALRFDGTRYVPTHIGPFLVGALSAELPFGQKATSQMVLVRHQSCTECDPWTYLSVLDFLRPNGDVFLFNYAANHDGFGHTIEYALPGMGHSVDATVETRAVPPSEVGPHLLQRFELDNGTVEWWIFTCKDLKCDYEMTTSGLPKKYSVAWDKGRRM